MTSWLVFLKAVGRQSDYSRRVQAGQLTENDRICGEHGEIRMELLKYLLEPLISCILLVLT